jgi:hypothetical protein
MPSGTLGQLFEDRGGIDLPDIWAGKDFEQKTCSPLRDFVRRNNPHRQSIPLRHSA